MLRLPLCVRRINQPPQAIRTGDAIDSAIDDRPHRHVSTSPAADRVGRTREQSQASSIYHLCNDNSYAARHCF